MELFIIVGSLCLVMGANILLGASIATLKKDFNKENLKNGLFKAGCVILGLTCLYLSAILSPDIMVASINGVNMNVIDVMRVLFTAGFALYSAKAINKLKDLLKVSTDIKDVLKEEQILVDKTNEIKFDKGE